jgi:hypothetical protein
MTLLSDILDFNKNSDKTAILYVNTDKKNERISYKDLNATLNSVII